MGPMAWIPTGSVSVSLCRAVDAASLGAAFQSSHFDRAPRSRTGQDGQRREDAYKLESGRTSNGSSHDDDDITCDDCRLLSVSHAHMHPYFKSVLRDSESRGPIQRPSFPRGLREASGVHVRAVLLSDCADGDDEILV